ncbi:vigilin-like [Penaeus vannamei]|uniref:vigilin-like n=1 Tax=Penaeus vannamei TaxID=6689 RepID=UPI00387F7091
MASLDIAPAHYGKAIGKGGARLKYIYDKFKVWVSVPTDGKSPITVSGESSSVRGAIKELEELVQRNVLKQSVFLPVNILPEDLGVAIGKGGSYAAKVKEEFGIKIHTKAREHPESLLVIEGLLNAAEKVMASIELHIAERRRLNEEFPVCVEPGWIGKVIGKGRFRIRYVVKRHSMRIQPDAQILMMSLRENALAVAKLQLTANYKLLPQDVHVPLRIEHGMDLFVLGPKGCRAAKIWPEFGVRIVRPIVNGPLMFQGSVEGVPKAEALVEQLLAGRRQAMADI